MTEIHGRPRGGDRWLPGVPAVPGRVVAVVDHRPCSMAAVRHAVPLASGTPHPLTVLLVEPGSALLASVSSMAVPSTWSDDLQAEFVCATARIMASSGVPWDFGILDATSTVESWCGGRPDGVVVVADHRHGLLGRALHRARLVRIPPVLGDPRVPLAVVGCEGRWRARRRARPGRRGQ